MSGAKGIKKPLWTSGSSIHDRLGSQARPQGLRALIIRIYRDVKYPSSVHVTSPVFTASSIQTAS